MGSKFRFGPLVFNEVRAGREPRMMDMPVKGMPMAFETIQMIEREMDNYFGRMTPEVTPSRVQTKQAMLVSGFLLMWSEAFAQMVDLCQQYMDDAEFSMITGAPQGWLDSRRGMPGLMGVDLSYDVRQLDPEFTLKQLEIINNTVIPADVTGSVDRAKWTMLQLPAEHAFFLCEQRACNPPLHTVAENFLPNIRLSVKGHGFRPHASLNLYCANIRHYSINFLNDHL